MTTDDYAFDDIKVGQKASFTHTCTDEEVQAFAALSGDDNPLHLDAAYAGGTRFKKPLVHGMFLAALCSKLVGTRLPGKRSLYVNQTLNFRKPVFPGDTLLVEGVITAKSAVTRLIEILITMKRGEDTVFDGVANVQIL